MKDYSDTFIKGLILIFFLKIDSIYAFGCSVLDCSRLLVIGKFKRKFYVVRVYMTSVVVSAEIPIVAIEPLLNFIKSVSIPSLKITPLVGIKDSIVRLFFVLMIPAEIPVCVLML